MIHKAFCKCIENEKNSLFPHKRMKIWIFIAISSTSLIMVILAVEEFFSFFNLFQKCLQNNFIICQKITCPTKQYLNYVLLLTKRNFESSSGIYSLLVGIENQHTVHTVLTLASGWWNDKTYSENSAYRVNATKSKVYYRYSLRLTVSTITWGYFYFKG